MPDLHPQYITDTAGNSLVVLSQQEFDTLMEELVELEEFRQCGNAKKNDNSRRISIEYAFANMGGKRNNSL